MIHSLMISEYIWLKQKNFFFSAKIGTYDPLLWEDSIRKVVHVIGLIHAPQRLWYRCLRIIFESKQSREKQKRPSRHSLLLQKLALVVLKSSSKYIQTSWLAVATSGQSRNSATMEAVWGKGGSQPLIHLTPLMWNISKLP